MVTDCRGLWATGTCDTRRPPRHIVVGPDRIGTGPSRRRGFGSEIPGDTEVEIESPLFIQVPRFNGVGRIQGFGG